MLQRKLIIISIVILSWSNSLFASGAEVLTKTLKNYRLSFLEATITASGEKRISFDVKARHRGSISDFMINLDANSSTGDKLLLKSEKDDFNSFRYSYESKRVRKVNRLKLKKMLEKNDAYALVSVLSDIKKENSSKKNWNLQEDGNLYIVSSKKDDMRIKINKLQMSISEIWVRDEVEVIILENKKVNDNGKEKIFPVKLNIKNLKEPSETMVNITIKSVGKKLKDSLFEKKTYYK